MEPVFMDRGGRRRRLFTALGAAIGVLLIAGGGLLIAGLLGSSPVPLPGLPSNGQGMLQRGDADGAGVLGTRAPAPAPSARSVTVRPQVSTAAAGPATPTPTPGATTDKPGKNKPSHPGNNPKPSRTK
ncbi:hypothetical protein [Dactylosporangium sp. NPDC051484]|uniref:hypothetical protein n=1 Tax=Dactylosporangium sp. NPDC051484 TaxID=3154942 RepID=UPI00344D440A